MILAVLLMTEAQAYPLPDLPDRSVELLIHFETDGGKLNEKGIPLLRLLFPCVQMSPAYYIFLSLFPDFHILEPGPLQASTIPYH